MATTLKRMVPYRTLIPFLNESSTQLQERSIILYHHSFETLKTFRDLKKDLARFAPDRFQFVIDYAGDQSFDSSAPEMLPQVNTLFILTQGPNACVSTVDGQYYRSNLLKTWLQHHGDQIYLIDPIESADRLPPIPNLSEPDFEGFQVQRLAYVPASKAQVAGAFLSTHTAFLFYGACDMMSSLFHSAPESTSDEMERDSTEARFESDVTWR